MAPSFVLGRPNHLNVLAQYASGSALPAASLETILTCLWLLLSE